ncbi:lipoyl(octanoyl) transferase LipB [Parenemella sanctibonifatiensis]|uniref:Octanoyltransferase n=1 Tax=Parenemella sanctibonifatiensis TaxID=2016505 RepID=A0A255EDX8_9ACTN|nr:lipoyl(octanoyl) transferase LipB [Parenemella sanctibonifatiensis]OYN89767.1 lipoate-protein ligase B [Parenemella sanctibonifatiensis]
MAVVVEHLGLAEGELIDYQEAWDLQRRIHAEVADGSRPDTILCLQHAPVFTAGRRTLDSERPTDGSPVVDVDRGGKITFHGPGQLVVYPIVRLPQSVGVVDFVRRVEEAQIRMLADLGLTTGPVQRRTGVWVGSDEHRAERKITAIGIRVARKTTMHGLALNLSTDLSWFDRIVPCGIEDAGVTSVEQELGRAPSLVAAAEMLVPRIIELMSWEPFTAAPEVSHWYATPTLAQQVQSAR